MNVLLGLSVIFIFGLIASHITERLKIPAVNAYLFVGILLGPHILNFVPLKIIQSSGLITSFVLSIIAFNLGANLTLEVFRQVGKQVAVISLLSAFGAWFFVFVSCVLYGLPMYACLLFGAIAIVTAPAAIIIEIRQLKAKGNFTDILMGVVALDDLWGLIIFSGSLMFARAIYHEHRLDLVQTGLVPVLEIAKSFLLGGTVGLGFNFFTRFITHRREVLIYTLGLVLLTAGLAIYYKLSVLLSCMVLGAMVVNGNKDNLKYFDIIQEIDWPLYLFFFVLAGANFELNHLLLFSPVGIIYILARFMGKFFGVQAGAVISKADKDVRSYLAVSQLPQAGIALGMALIAKSYFGQIGGEIFTVIAAATIIHEIIGPYCVRYALRKTNQYATTSQYPSWNSR